VSEDATRVLGSRVVSFVIDGVIGVGVCLAVFLTLAHKAPAGFPVPQSGLRLQLTVNENQWYANGGRATLVLLIIVAFSLSYYAVLPGKTGWTLGKRVTNIRVVGPDGVAPAGTWRNFVRGFLWIADGFPYVVPGFVGWAVAAASSQRRRIGDMVANTYVIRGGRPPRVTGSGYSPFRGP
jgi:uncharacterized RDD family membrane protein YckC